MMYGCTQNDISMYRYLVVKTKTSHWRRLYLILHKRRHNLNKMRLVGLLLSWLLLLAYLPVTAQEPVPPANPADTMDIVLVRKTDRFRYLKKGFGNRITDAGRQCISGAGNHKILLR